MPVTTELSRSAAYDYELPPGLIARYPTERRDESRLLVQGAGEPAHRRFRDLPLLLREGDLLVLNESRVIPVRLLGRKPSGARCEVLLIRPWMGSLVTGDPLPATHEPPPPATPDPQPVGTHQSQMQEAVAGGDDADREESRLWEALVRPGSKLKPGRRVVISEGLVVHIEDGTPEGGRIVRLESDLPVREAMERWGRIPLPPYMEREEEALDRERYQTVYARVPGSVAAPTAGLHFTPELLERVERRGVEIARVALHVGPGTFRPVEVERVEDHVMHMEQWVVPEETSAAIRRTRERGGRVWAVGTTVVRTLESWARAEGRLEGDTRLFITPGFDFRVVEGLVTNFHLPRSTLLMLVSAFAGHARTMAAYAEAIRERYRFYSYGDAMVIPPEGRGQ